MKKPAWIAAGAAVLWLTIAWSALPSDEQPPAAAAAPSEAIAAPAVAPATLAVPALRPAQPKPPAPPPPHPMPAPAPVDEGDLAENEEIEAEVNTSEQRAWRASWASEQHDERWTQQVARDIKKRGESVLRGDLKLHDLSCRETVCRLFLQFADRDDAQAFMAEPMDQSLHHEYQRLDPQFEGPDHPQSSLEYELMIVQKEGALREHRHATGSEDPIELPGEDELLTIVARKAPEP